VDRVRTSFGLSRSPQQVVEALVALGHKELKKTGMFVLHGFAQEARAARA